MGLIFRKSFKVGPARVSFSKKGMSTSVGGKGCRVTKRADGRIQGTIGMPGTGVRYTETLGGKQEKTMQSGDFTLTEPDVQKLKILTPILQVLSALVVLLSFLVMIVNVWVGLGFMVLGTILFLVARHWRKRAKEYIETN